MDVRKMYPVNSLSGVGHTITSSVTCRQKVTVIIMIYCPDGRGDGIARGCATLLLSSTTTCPARKGFLHYVLVEPWQGSKHTLKEYVSQGARALKYGNHLKHAINAYCMYPSTARQYQNPV